MVPIHNGVLVIIKWNLAICEKDGPWGYYAKSSKSEKDEYHIVSLMCGVWKTNTHNPPPERLLNTVFDIGEENGEIGETGKGD